MHLFPFSLRHASEVLVIRLSLHSQIETLIILFRVKLFVYSLALVHSLVALVFLELAAQVNFPLRSEFLRTVRLASEVQEVVILVSLDSSLTVYPQIGLFLLASFV